MDRPYRQGPQNYQQKSTESDQHPPEARVSYQGEWITNQIAQSGRNEDRPEPAINVPAECRHDRIVPLPAPAGKELHGIHGRKT